MGRGVNIFNVHLIQINQVSKSRFSSLLHSVMLAKCFGINIIFKSLNNCVTAQIRELDSVLCQVGRTSQVIWTSSSNAHRSAFNLEDVQHQRGTQPYSSSRYATDLLSLAINTHYNKQVDSPFLCAVSSMRVECFQDTNDHVAFQGLYSSVICPGFVMTSLTYNILPSFPALLWTLLMPVFWLVSPTLTVQSRDNVLFYNSAWIELFCLQSQIRIFTNTFTLTPYNGAEALVGRTKHHHSSHNSVYNTITLVLLVGLVV